VSDVRLPVESWVFASSCNTRRSQSLLWPSSIRGSSALVPVTFPHLVRPYRRACPPRTVRAKAVRCGGPPIVFVVLRVFFGLDNREFIPESEQGWRRHRNRALRLSSPPVLAISLAEECSWLSRHFFPPLAIRSDLRPCLFSQWNPPPRSDPLSQPSPPTARLTQPLLPKSLIANYSVFSSGSVRSARSLRQARVLRQTLLPPWCEMSSCSFSTGPVRRC